MWFVRGSNDYRSQPCKRARHPWENGYNESSTASYGMNASTCTGLTIWPRPTQSSKPGAAIIMRAALTWLSATSRPRNMPRGQELGMTIWVKRRAKLILVSDHQTQAAQTGIAQWGGHHIAPCASRHPAVADRPKAHGPTIHRYGAGC